MRCIAHRGFAGAYPENTLTAVSNAYDHVDVVEIDVRRCGSGELVVVHDERVDRLTDATGPVAGYSRQELAALNVLGSGDGVPTLDDVLDVVPDDGELNVELKADGLAADVVAAAEAAGVDVLLSSFAPDRLRAAREAGGDRLAYLFADDTTPVEVARELDCTAIHPLWKVCDREFVDRAHEAGLAVNAWTVPTRQDRTTLTAAGVDGIIVDTPDICPTDSDVAVE